MSLDHRTGSSAELRGSPTDRSDDSSKAIVADRESHETRYTRYDPRLSPDSSEERLHVCTMFGGMQRRLGAEQGRIVPVKSRGRPDSTCQPSGVRRHAILNCEFPSFGDAKSSFRAVAQVHASHAESAREASYRLFTSREPHQGFVPDPQPSTLRRQS